MLLSPAPNGGRSLISYGHSLVQGHAGRVVGKCDAIFFERRLAPSIGLGADFQLLARQRLNPCSGIS
jgi:hypothetical protein